MFAFIVKLNIMHSGAQIMKINNTVTNKKQNKIVIQKSEKLIKFY